MVMSFFKDNQPPVNILDGVPTKNKRAKVVDDIVKSFKNPLPPEEKEAKKKNLRKLFDGKAAPIISLAPNQASKQIMKAAPDTLHGLVPGSGWLRDEESGKTFSIGAGGKMSVTGRNGANLGDKEIELSSLGDLTGKNTSSGLNVLFDSSVPQDRRDAFMQDPSAPAQNRAQTPRGRYFGAQRLSAPAQTPLNTFTDIMRMKAGLAQEKTAADIRQADAGSEYYGVKSNAEREEMLSLPMRRRLASLRVKAEEDMYEGLSDKDYEGEDANSVIEEELKKAKKGILK